MTTPRVTRFVPQVHGFKFTNANGWQITLADLGLDSFYESIGVPPPPIGDSFGLCGGMCFSALDFYFSGTQIPSLPQKPAIGSAMFGELVDRQLASLGNWVWMKVWEWQISPDKPHWYAPHTVGYRTKQEWPSVKASLDAGIPIMLCLICSEGVGGSLTDNHQVLAHHYEYGEDGRLYILIYDPNFPETFKRLSVNFSLPENNIDGRYDGLTRLRGFFPIRYDRQTIVASVTQATIDSCAFERAEAVLREGQPRRLNWFTLIFSWQANFVPCYTLSIDQISDAESTIWDEVIIEKPQSFHPLPKSGQKVLRIGSYGLSPHTAGLEVAESFLGERTLLPPAPSLSGLAYLHKAESHSWPAAAIINDASEKLGDVVVQDANPSAQVVTDYSDRIILVSGAPEGDLDSPYSALARVRIDSRLGYVAKPVFCRVDYANLITPAAFRWKAVRLKFNPDGSIVILDYGHEQVLSEQQLEGFQFAGPFSANDYANDVRVDLHLWADDAAGANMQYSLRLFARSLLIFTVPVYAPLVDGANWTNIRDRIRPFIDRELVKQLTGSLSVNDRNVIMRHDEQFVAACLDEASPLWSEIANLERFKGGLKKLRVDHFQDYLDKVKSIALESSSILEIQGAVTQFSENWRINDSRATARLYFQEIFQTLALTRTLSRIIASLPRQ